MPLIAPPIILASSSTYRRKLLEQVGLSFEWAAPEIDETRQYDETAIQLTRRLAEQKANALLHRFPCHLLIASDQVAVLDNQVLGKPQTPQKAIQQLTDCSGRSVTFLTSLCVLNSNTGNRHLSVDSYTVDFRQLTEAQIIRYIERDAPLDCAGSFKVEGLGAALFTGQHGNDPSSLIGLPLIALCSALAKEGVDVLS